MLGRILHRRPARAFHGGNRRFDLRGLYKPDRLRHFFDRFFHVLAERLFRRSFGLGEVRADGRLWPDRMLAKAREG